MVTGLHLFQCGPAVYCLIAAFSPILTFFMADFPTVVFPISAPLSLIITFEAAHRADKLPILFSYFFASAVAFAW